MEEFEWGILIVNYLFLAGVSAGAFAISAIGTLVNSPHFRRIASIGALVAPWPAAIGVGLLVFDLGRPLAFINLFLTIQFTSPMSIGAWLLTVFVLLSLVYAALWLPAPFDNLLRLPSGWKNLGSFSRWQSLSRTTIRSWRRNLAIFGLPIAIGIGIYTGVLLGAVPSRPFWNTPMLAWLFLFSAMSTGTATVLVVTTLLANQGNNGHKHERHLLVITDAILIGVELVMLAMFIMYHALSTGSSSASLSLILGGELTGLFWVGTVLFGITLPLIMELYELYPVVLKEGTVRYGLALSTISGLLVLVGGFILRYVFVYAGQMSHFLPLMTH